MKRFTVLLFSILLLAAMMATPVFATTDGGSAAVSAATSKPGDTVEVTFSLQGYDEVTSLAVTYNVPDGLQLQSAQWLLNGTIADVNLGKKQAVWTKESPVALTEKTKIFKLTFTVLEPAAGQTNLTYDVNFKSKVTLYSDTLGNPTAGAKVAVVIPASGVTLSSTSLALDLKGTTSAVLTATVTPANSTETLSWTSSDPSVASVSNGTVTAHKRGTAAITAKAGSVSKTCTVTVSCSHELVETKAKTPTCQQTGNKQYYTCSICDTVLAADKKTETTVKDQTLATVSHSGGTATCTEQAVCTMCKQPYGSKLEHSMTHHAAVKATCVKAGTVEYWTCSSSGCTGKYYGDAKGQTVLTTIVEAVNPDNHTGGTELKNAVTATCSEAGYSGDTYCKSCKELIQKGETVPATGKHTPEKEYLTDDNQHWQICSYCDAVVGKTNHTFTWVVDKKPTETAEGSEHEECTVCGVKRSEDTAIEKLKHTPVLVDGKEPTCTEDGAAEHFYCVNCGSYYTSDAGQIGARISKSDITLAATGHSFGEEWLSDEENHWHVCACGETSEPEAHEPELVNEAEATETEEGYTGDTVCTVCDHVIAAGEAIPTKEPESTDDLTVMAPVDETEPQEETASDAGGSVMLWIIPVLIVIAIVLFLLIAKKRKKSE